MHVHNFLNINKVAKLVILLLKKLVYNYRFLKYNVI